MIEEFSNYGDTLKIVSETPGLSESGEVEAKNWLSCDQYDPGFQLMTEDKIIASLRNDEEVSANYSDDGKEGDYPGPSHNNTFNALDLSLAWMEGRSTAPD